METVYKVTVNGTNQRTGQDDRETYLIDLGRAAEMGNAEQRAKHEAKQKAYSDGIAPQHAYAEKAHDYVECPHCDEPISSDRFD